MSIKGAVICFGNCKGGVGKSSLSVFTAVEAAKHNKKVLLIDADPQKSSAAWRASREANDIVCTSITEPTIHKDIQTLASGYDLVIIDAGGRDTGTFRSAILASDILVIPVLPSQFDIYAAEDTVKILTEARVYRDNIKAFFILNQLLTNTIISREAEEALIEITEGSDIPLMKTKLFARVAYKKCLDTGVGVTEYEPVGKAADEVRSMFRELMKAIGEGGKK
jgi:chromosome partitioning protein